MAVERRYALSTRLERASGWSWCVVVVVKSEVRGRVTGARAAAPPR